MTATETATTMTATGTTKTTVPVSDAMRSLASLYAEPSERRDPEAVGLAERAMDGDQFAMAELVRFAISDRDFNLAIDAKREQQEVEAAIVDLGSCHEEAHGLTATLSKCGFRMFFESEGISYIVERDEWSEWAASPGPREQSHSGVLPPWSSIEEVRWDARAECWILAMVQDQLISAR